MTSINEQTSNDNTEFLLLLLLLANTIYRRKLKNILRSLEKSIIGEVASNDVANLNKRKLKSLLNNVYSKIDDSYNNLNKALADDLLDIAKLSSETAIKSINNNIKFELLTNSVTVEQLKTLLNNDALFGAVSSEWWTRQSTSLKNKFADVLRSGILSGKSTSEIVKSLRENLNITNSKKVEALVRTSVASINNQSKLLVYQKNKDVFKGFQQISTLDSRTTDICIAYSGKMWDMDYNPIGHDLPYNDGVPRHWGCRSVIVPIIKSFKDLGLNIDEVPKTVRASIDGYVPQDITFEEFLKKKGIAFQNKTLGKERAKLFREGKITLLDLISSDGSRSLTLNEIRNNLHL